MKKSVLWLGTGFILLSVLAVAKVVNAEEKTAVAANTTQASITAVTVSGITVSSITTEGAVNNQLKNENAVSGAESQINEATVTTDGVIIVDKKKLKVKNERYVVDKKYEPEEGKATWYGGGFNGRKTTNGEIFDTKKFTSAHRTIPFGTLVKVTNIRNGKFVIVRVNDRCHAAPKKVRIDLTYAAYSYIGTKKDDGFMGIRIERLKAVE